MYTSFLGLRNLGAPGFPIDDCISFLLAKAGQQVARRFRDVLAGYGVTPVQYAVLSVLWEKQGLSSADLSSRLVIDSATMTGLLVRMEQLQLVTRRPDADDRRVSRIHLSARAQRLRKPLIAAVAELNRDIARQLGGEESTFRSLLRRLGEAPVSEEAAR